MELFKEINTTDLDKDSLKKLLTIEKLPALCLSIDTVVSDSKDNGVIHCLWGEHEVSRELIKEGVRFSMPKCPNALTWSITAKKQAVEDNENHNVVIIHCTTNSRIDDEDFLESIHEFVDDWKSGIASL